MTQHQFGGTALAIGILVALSGCVGEAPPPTPAPTLPLTEETHATDDGEVVEAPTAAADSQAAAIRTAEDATAAFARPDLSADAWYDGMLPYLSQRGATAYYGTDPADIRVTAVTGSGTVLEGSTEVLLIVVIPTDAGDYNVTLTRSSVDDPWLVERIRPAQG